MGRALLVARHAACAVRPKAVAATLYHNGPRGAATRSDLFTPGDWRDG
jgi:hypothetical protein